MTREMEGGGMGGADCLDMWLVMSKPLLKIAQLRFTELLWLKTTFAWTCEPSGIIKTHSN